MDQTTERSGLQRSETAYIDEESVRTVVVVKVVFVDLVINGSSGQTGIIRNPSCCTVTVSAVTIYAARARTVMILLELRGGKRALTINSTYPTVRHTNTKRTLVAGESQSH